MLTQNKLLTYLKWLLIFNSIFSIIGTLMFTFPFSFEKQFQFLNLLNSYLGWGGYPLLPPSDMLHVLFVNIVGIDVSLISGFVIFAAQDIYRRKAIIKSYIIARTIVFGLTIFYVMYYDLLKVILLFGVIDLLFILFQVYTMLKIKKLEVS